MRAYCPECAQTAEAYSRSAGKGPWWYSRHVTIQRIHLSSKRIKRRRCMKSNCQVLDHHLRN